MPHQLNKKNPIALEPSTNGTSNTPTITNSITTSTNTNTAESNNSNSNMNRTYNNHHPGHGLHTYPPPASVWSSRSWQPAARDTYSNPLQESAEQAAASALLIAAGGPRKEEVDRLQQQQQRSTTNIKQEDKSISSSSTAVKAESQPVLVCHVSPHSTEGEPSSSTQIISDFPAKLHRVLTNSEFAGTVLEWLPTGTSWRVLRWNELSTAVIPKHFPELLNEDTTRSSGKDGGGSGSSSEEEVTSDRMNRFLYQIKAHGFEEIRIVGPEMGAYRHEFFIKVAPNLCRHMKSQVSSTIPVGRSPSFQSNEDTTSMPPSDKKIVSPPRTGPRGRFSNTSPERMTEPPGHPSHPNATNMANSEDRPPSLHRGSPRFVSLQEQDVEQQHNTANVAGDGGSSGSPRNYLTTSDRSRKMINHVSPLTQVPHIYNENSNLGTKFHLDLSSMRVPDSPYPRGMVGSYEIIGTAGSGTRLRSNRGGSRAMGRNTHSNIRDIPSPPRRSSFPVSTRGRGLCTSSRGRGRIPASRHTKSIDPEMMKGQHIPQKSMDIMRLYRNDAFTKNTVHVQANAKRQRVGNSPHEDAIVSR